MTWLLNESAALKDKLSGITVHGTAYQNQTIEVPVHFVGVDQELGTMDFPGIYIRYGPIAPAPEREIEGFCIIPYAPEGFTGNIQVPEDITNPDDNNTVPWLTEDSEGDPLASPYFSEDFPRPYDIHFDINVLARDYQQAYELIGILASPGYLPYRNGFLSIPQDGTSRTLELLGGPEAVVSKFDQDEKKFIDIRYSISVASELFPYQIEMITRVQTVDVTLTDIEP